MMKEAELALARRDAEHRDIHAAKEKEVATPTRRLSRVEDANEASLKEVAAAAVAKQRPNE
jgi:hypothetical protein